MDRLQNIVVGVDFSKFSEQALTQAVRMAQWNRAKLHIVHVIDSTVLVDLQAALSARIAREKVSDQVLSTTRERIDQLLARMPATETKLDIEIDMRTGHPLVEILRAVRDKAADLLVLGSNGSSLPHQGAGALATNCVRKAPTKVLLVRESQSAPFKRIVACVDFSETSHQAVEQAIRVAKQDGAHLDIAHVFAPPWQQLHYRAPTPEAAPDYQQQYKMHLEGSLRQFVKPFESDLAGLTVEYHLLGSNLRPADAIVDFLKTNGADLAALGIRGRSAILVWFLGSIAERIVRESPCSVLTLKPKGFRLDIA
jgi:nucleotide-binding universal stress UspA family protein